MGGSSAILTLILRGIRPAAERVWASFHFRVVKERWALGARVSSVESTLWIDSSFPPNPDCLLTK